MRFHLALPELNGLGVMTFTPLLTRLAQLVMCLGLPLRTTNDTIELVTMPWVGVALHLAETMPAFTSLCHVGGEREVDHVGGQAVDHGGGLGARGAEGLGEGHPLAGLVALNALIRAA